MRPIPPRDDGTHKCMMCPNRVHAITTGFLDCPSCDAKFFCMDICPPRVDLRSNPEGRKIAEEARMIEYKVSRRHSAAHNCSGSSASYGGAEEVRRQLGSLHPGVSQPSSGATLDAWVKRRPSMDTALASGQIVYMPGK